MCFFSNECCLVDQLPSSLRQYFCEVDNSKSMPSASSCFQMRSTEKEVSSHCLYRFIITIRRWVNANNGIISILASDRPIATLTLVFYGHCTNLDISFFTSSIVGLEVTVFYCRKRDFKCVSIEVFFASFYNLFEGFPDPVLVSFRPQTLLF